jgi:hypothetical protein
VRYRHEHPKHLRVCSQALIHLMRFEHALHTHMLATYQTIELSFNNVHAESLAQPLTAEREREVYRQREGVFPLVLFFLLHLHLSNEHSDGAPKAWEKGDLLEHLNQRQP